MTKLAVTYIFVRSMREDKQVARSTKMLLDRMSTEKRYSRTQPASQGYVVSLRGIHTKVVLDLPAL